MTPPLVLPIEPARQPSGPDRTNAVERSRDARRERFDTHLRPPKVSESGAGDRVRAESAGASGAARSIRQKDNSGPVNETPEAPVSEAAEGQQTEELSAEESPQEESSELAGAAGIVAPAAPQPKTQSTEVTVEESATDAVTAIAQEAGAAEGESQQNAETGETFLPALSAASEAGEVANAKGSTPTSIEATGDASSTQTVAQQSTATGDPVSAEPQAAAETAGASEANEAATQTSDLPGSDQAEAAEPEKSQGADPGEGGTEKSESAVEGESDRLAPQGAEDRERQGDNAGGEQGRSEVSQTPEEASANPAPAPVDPAASAAQPAAAAVTGAEGLTDQIGARQQDTSSAQASVGQIGENPSSSQTQRNPAADGAEPSAASVGHVAERFVRRVAGAFRAAEQNGGAVQLRLSPPELGSLQVRISIQDGAMTARLEADNAAARTLLIDNLPALRDRLAQQDIRIEKFEVDVRRDGAGGSQQQAFEDSGTRSRQAQNTPGGRRVSVSAPAAGPAPSALRAVRPGGLNVVA